MSGRWHSLLLLLIIVCGLSACDQGPKTDLDVRARVYELYQDQPGFRCDDMETGRQYRVLITESTQIRFDDETWSSEDIELGYHLRVRANQSATPPFYDAVIIDVLDTAK